MLRTSLLAILAATPALADVNVYSYRQPELLAPLVEAYQNATGSRVNVAFIQDGLVERLKAEGARSPADLVMTVDIARLAELVDEGLTQPIESKVLDESVPAAFRDPDGQWWALTSRARVVYASNERVQDEEVTTYEDLASDKWKGRICTRSGLHDYMVALTAAMIYHHGEDYAREWLAGLKANLARKPQGNDRAQVRAIWAGECDISLGNTYYMGAMLNDPEQTAWAESVHLLFPKFEDGGTHVNVSGVVMTAHAPNREEALDFVEFLVSPEAQEVYAEANNEYPIVPGTKISDLVASWGTFTPDDVNLMDLARLRGDALRITQEVDYDG